MAKFDPLQKDIRVNQLNKNFGTIDYNNCGTMPDDVKDCVATHSFRLQQLIICMPQLEPWC